MQLLPSWDERLGRHLHCQTQYKKAIPRHWIIDETYSVLSNHLHPKSDCWDGTVSIATHYELDSPGFETWCGRDFPCPSRPASRPTQRPVQWALCLPPGAKLGRVRHWPPTPFQHQGCVQVELNFYLPSVPSWYVSRWSSLLFPEFLFKVVILCSREFSIKTQKT